MHGEKRGVYRVLVGKSEGKIPLGRTRWDNNSRMHVQELGCEGINWVDVAQDRDRWWANVNAVKELGFP